MIKNDFWWERQHKVKTMFANQKIVINEFLKK